MFLPGGSRKWTVDKVTKLATPRAIINPAWVNASYEYRFVFSEPGMTAFLAKTGEWAEWAEGSSRYMKEPWPVRTLDREGKQVVPTFIFT
jgi:hypothetical protein